MTDVSLADQLSVLLEVNVGLLTRVGYHKDVLSSDKKPAVLGVSDYDKVRKALVKAYPNPANVEKQIQGFDTFQSQAKQIRDETEPYFQTCMEVLSFLEEVSAFFRDALIQKHMEFKFDSNQQMMAQFMDLYVGHIQIQLFLGSSADIKATLSVYGQAYACIHGKQDANWTRLAPALQRIFDGPWRKIQEEMNDLSAPIGEMLNSLYMPYINGFNFDNLRTSAILNPSADMSTLTMPAYKPIYQDLLLLDRMGLWVIYGALSCPTQFVNPNIMELFKLVARSGFQVQIFRDEVFNYHDEIEKLFGWFPNKVLEAKFPKDVKPKRIMGDLAKSSVICAGLDHRERRSYLTGELQNMLHMLVECPALLAPKFPMVLAGLSMAKGELLWYFQHLNRPIPNRVKAKSFLKEAYAAPHISKLFHLVHTMTRLVHQHAQLVGTYYLQYLRGADMADLRAQIDTVQSCTSGLNPSIVAALQGIVGTLSAISPEAHAAQPDALDLEGMRVTWDRLLALFCSGAGAPIRRMPGVEPLIKRMRTVVRHSLYADRSRQLLARYCELGELWWYRSQIFGPKPGAEEFASCLYGPDDQPLCAVAMVAATVSAAGNNLSDFCPEQRALFEEEVKQEAEQQLDKVAHGILSLLEPIVHEQHKFDQQIAPIEAAHRLHRQQEQRKAAGKGQSILIGAEPMAGFESKPQARAVISGLVSRERNLAQLCFAVAEAEPLVAFDRSFQPHVFVKEKLQWALQDYMRKSADSSLGGGKIERPTVLLEKVHRFLRCCQRGLAHLGLNLSTIARRVMLQETFDPKISNVGDVLQSAPRMEIDPNSMVSKLADFYIAMVDTHATSTVTDTSRVAGTIVFSHFRQAFVRNLTSSKGTFPVDAELFTSPAELSALCTLIGPQGVRVIDSRLLAVVERRVTAIKGLIANDRSLLLQLSEQYKEDGKWLEVCKQLTCLDELMEHSVRVGIALHMRQLLRNALGQVAGRRTPHLKEVVRLAYEQYPENTYRQQDYEALDVVADDLGIAVGAADHSLKAALSTLKTSSDDSKLWDLLPFAYAATLTSNGWKKADYIPHIDSYSNNAHVMAFAIQKLILCFQSNIVVNPTGGSPIEIALTQYISCSSFILLRMKLLDDAEFREYPIRAMYVFMEKFIEGSEHLERCMLQNCLPYALLHAAYVDMSLGRNRASDEAQSSKKLFGTESTEESHEQTGS